MFSDETHSLMCTKFSMHVIGVFDMIGNFVPLLEMLTSRAEEEDIDFMFRAFFSSVPEGCGFKPQVIMTDKAPVYSAVFRRAAYKDIIHRWCYWCARIRLCTQY